MSQITIDDVVSLTTPQAMMQAIDNNFDELYSSTTPRVISGQEYTSYTSSTNPEINTLIDGSTLGGLIKAGGIGHFVIGLRENDNYDSFNIISGGGDWATDQTWDTLVFRARADGHVFIPNGSLSIQGSTALTELSKVQASIKEYGAIGNGIHDDSSAEDSAHAAEKAVTYPYGEYDSTDSSYNLYDAGVYEYTYGLSHKIQSGLPGSPVTDKSPVLWSQKFISSTYGDTGDKWDQGGLYSSVIKMSGAANCAGATIYSRAVSGSGDVVGTHSRVKLDSSATARGYAFWGYAKSTKTTAPEALHGAELNANVAVDPGYGGAHQLLRLCMADSSADANRFSTAISIGPSTVSGGTNGFWTGINFEANSIVPTSGTWADGEVMNVVGPSSNSIGGIRFSGGNMKYALRTDEATFSEVSAIILGKNHFIRWGSDGSSNVGITAGSSIFTIQNGVLNISDPISTQGIQISSTRVLCERKTGWTAPSGTATRTSFSTSTATVEEVAERLKALIDDLISHGMIGA